MNIYRFVVYLGLASLAVQASEPETAAAAIKYKDKFVKLLGSDSTLPLGFCKGVSLVGGGTAGDGYPGVKWNFEQTRIWITNDDGCSEQVFHPGETLTVKWVRTYHHGKTVNLVLVSGQRSFTRGIGAFEHQVVERGGVLAVFKGGSATETRTLIDRWLSFSDTEPGSLLGNTASHVSVEEVHLGMTFAEVESVLGVPVTRADLGAKVLYRYKALTVEFNNGKVIDVR